MSDPELADAGGDGHRRIACPQDVPQVAELLFICFSSALDASSRQMLQQVHWIASKGSASWNLGCLLGAVNREEWEHCVVWTEGGRPVANVTLSRRLPEEGVWLLSNVAVHPDFRRRGIARKLVGFALDEVRRMGGRQIHLQVDAENETAAVIYRELGFRESGCRVTWYLPAGRRQAERLLTGRVDSVRVDLRRKSEWREEFEFLIACTPSGLVWNAPLRAERIRPSFWRFLDRTLVGESEEHLLARCDGMLAAVFIATRKAYSWEGMLIQRSGTAGQVEESILKLFLQGRGAETSGVLETTAEADPDIMAKLGFQLRRTLVWMQYDLPANPQAG